MPPRKTPAPAPAGKAWIGKLAEAQRAPSDNPYLEFREELHAWVKDAYERWKADPTDWRILTFDTGEEADDAEKGAKWVISASSDLNVTFTRRNDKDPKVLIYRVRDKITKLRLRKDNPETAEESVNLTDGGQDDQDTATPDGQTTVEDFANTGESRDGTEEAETDSFVSEGSEYPS